MERVRWTSSSNCYLRWSWRRHKNTAVAVGQAGRFGLMARRIDSEILDHVEAREIAHLKTSKDPVSLRFEVKIELYD